MKCEQSSLFTSPTKKQFLSSLLSRLIMKFTSIIATKIEERREKRVNHCPGSRQYIKFETTVPGRSLKLSNLGHV